MRVSQPLPSRAGRAPARRRAAVCIALLALAVAGPTPARAAAEESPRWVRADAAGEPVVDLWFFWSLTCPHCHAAKPVVEGWAERFPWLDLHALEVTTSAENADRYRSLAGVVGEDARAVPAFVYCGRMRVGWDAETTPEQILGDLEQCRATARASLAAGGPARASLGGDDAPLASLRLPGGLDAEALSLPLLTLVLGGLDSVNPCAFFVLMVLLGLLVHARSRARMLAVGGVFVLFSGLVYFAFMAAWLNLFLVVGELAWVTTGAGLLAVAIGAFNVKDFVWLGQGPSLSIPDAAKPGLFRRMRELVGAERVGTMLLAAAALALAANAYELLCTAGLPMVFTRVLTLRALPTWQYYGWLALYNVVYVLPLLAIVGAFAWTLGARKLSERGARLLKLLSGLMMLALGVTLLVAPEAVSRPGTALALLAGAGLVTAIAAWATRPRAGRAPTSSGTTSPRRRARTGPPAGGR